jgi:23S rRNA (pseudouridine1915-N3)-methyltransferase
MRTVRILSVRKNTDPRIASLESEYVKRLRPFCAVELEDIRRTYGADLAARELLEKEAGLWEKRLGGRARFYALDRGGRVFSSGEFAAWVRKTLDAGDATFVIGGPYGLPDRILGRAAEAVSLSKMTLPHELARLVLLEQLHRAADILKGGAYHK